MSKRDLLLFTGGIMLFNPVVGIVDILPDAIGFLLIAIGLFPYSKVEMALGDARRNAFMLSAVGLFRMLLTPVVITSLYPDDKLLAAAGFAIVECIFGSIFMNHFFAGMSYIADRHGNGALSARYAEDTGIIKLFFQVRIWAPLLPELTALASDAAQNDDLHHDDLVAIAGLRNIIIAFTSLVVLVLGIIYLIRITKIYRASKADTEFRSFVETKYNEEYLSNAPKRFTRRMKLSRIFAVAGCACFIDLVIEDFPLFVPAYGMLLLALSLLIIGVTKRDIKCVIAMLVCAAADMVAEILKINAVDSSIIDILQITPQIVITGSLIALLSLAAWVVFGICFTKTYRSRINSLFGMDIPFTTPLVYASLMLIIRCVIIALPNLRMWVPTVYAVLTLLMVISASSRFFRTENGGQEYGANG